MSTILSEKEREERYVFYVEKLGKRKVDWIVKSRKHLWPVQTYHRVITLLESLSFTKAEEMIRRYPMLMSLSPATITERVEGIRRQELWRSVDIIVQYPRILSLQPRTLSRKIEGLKDVGLPNVFEVISLNPKILLFSIGTISETVAFLEQKGFDLSFVSQHPSILTISSHTLDEKITWVREQGFGHLLYRHPAILRTALRTLKRKMWLCRRFNIDIDTLLAGGHASFFITISAKHYTRIIRELKSKKMDATPQNVKKAYKTAVLWGNQGSLLRVQRSEVISVPFKDGRLE